MSDIIFVGGGLASLLTALRLKKKKPHLTIQILERDVRVAGNHTWSFHAKHAPHWLCELATSRWDKHEVRFPEYQRTIDSQYCSLRSETLQQLAPTYASIETGVNVTKQDRQAVQLSDGRTFRAACVIDGTGLNVSQSETYGYQKFVGLKLRLRRAHGVFSPVLMDARCPQHDGFHFFYLLPYSENEILVENTYYSENSSLDCERLKSEIYEYMGLIDADADVLYQEQGVLPIPLQWQPTTASTVPVIGMKAGFFNFVTGYSILVAARVADAIADLSELSTDLVQQTLQKFYEKEKHRRSYELMLNRMMFLAATPHQRIRIFSRFYKLPNNLIENFYAGRLSFWQRLRILSGKPPVPVVRAVRSLFLTTRKFV